MNNMSNLASSRSNRNYSNSDADIIFIENHFYSLSPESPPNGNSSHDDGWRFNENNEADATAVIKRRIKNTWNNAKYNNGVSRWILKRRSSFDQEQPVWLLGKMYSWNSDGLVKGSSSSKTIDLRAFEDAYDAFIADFSARIWFTYRKDFAKLNGCRLKSDCGWGCMLRCGQMLLAQAIICHILGRDWTFEHDRRPQKWHRQIVEWFLDCPRQPFSLHRLVELGLQYGKRGGDWYGPASTALILRDALMSFRCGPNDNNAVLDSLCVFVASDGVLYLDELQQAINAGLSDGRHHAANVLPRSLLLIVPLRLGADRFNPLYVFHLKTVLSLKSCIGMLGGRPKHSLYFVGWQGESLIYLDPHYCQRAVEVGKLDESSLQTFHCKWPRKIPFTDIDPSCAVGFYLRTGTDLADFFNELTDVVEYAEGKNAPLKFPLFSVMKRRPALDRATDDPTTDRTVRVDDFGGGGLTSTVRHSEYVLL